MNDWRDDPKRACAGRDTELWFANEGSLQGRRDVDDAVMICHTCPVVEKCAEYAIEHEEWGTWGALTETDRRKLRRRTA